MSIIEKAVKKLEGSGNQASDHGRDSPAQLASFSMLNQHSSEVNSDIPDGNCDHPQTVINIPFARMAMDGMLTPDKPKSQIAEEYRMIKRPLLMNIAGKGAEAVENSNLIMVTSAFQGEGKTFTALNLAISMCLEQDTTVLFIDADVSKASAGKLLGIESDQPGLIDLLEDQTITVNDVLLRTDISNLRIIPAGHLNERSTELLASEAMRELTIELSQRYADRIVIIDSPPLLLTSEASVLANFMGQIVFVVAAERTSQQAIHEALGHLGEDKIIGTVLNKAKRHIWDKHGYGYGYSYGYGYGYGYGSSRDNQGQAK